MAEIARISSGAPWEPIFGYSRAVRVGPWMVVSGTTSFGENGLIIGRNQMYVQARQAIENIASALGRAGMSLADVVRTRMFVTDISRFGEVARAHLEAFGENPPAATVVEVRRLINRDMMIEIEVDAYQSPAESAPAARQEMVEPLIEVIEMTAGIEPAPPKAKAPVRAAGARKPPSRKPRKKIAAATRARPAPAAAKPARKAPAKASRKPGKKRR